MEREDFQIVVSIPLLAQEKVLGAMNVASRSPALPSPEEYAVPASIGQQIGIAMDNARLYNQTVEYARRMEAAHREAEAARIAAEAANNAKSDFLANVSHELRTPLVSIFGFARIVQKRLRDRIFPAFPTVDEKNQRLMGQVDEDLEIILNEGQRLMTLINNLLDLEKIEAGRMEWHFQPLALEDLIHQATRSTAALFEGKPLNLEVNNRAASLPVFGDPDRLLQVFINLISNAVKSTPAGTITIRARRDGETAVVEVTDQGIGINRDDQALLFEKFRQVGDTMTEKPSGTGLGLAISKEIIEVHGGRIWLESEPGRGSTFSFSLPLAANDLFAGEVEDGTKRYKENPDRR
jgi:signal transduction histidine kinase